MQICVEANCLTPPFFLFLSLFFINRQGFHHPIDNKLLEVARVHSKRRTDMEYPWTLFRFTQRKQTLQAKWVTHHACKSDRHAKRQTLIFSSVLFLTCNLVSQSVGFFALFVTICEACVILTTVLSVMPFLVCSLVVIVFFVSCLRNEVRVIYFLLCRRLHFSWEASLSLLLQKGSHGANISKVVYPSFMRLACMTKGNFFE